MSAAAAASRRLSKTRSAASESHAMSPSAPAGGPIAALSARESHSHPSDCLCLLFPLRLFFYLTVYRISIWDSGHVPTRRLVPALCFDWDSPPESLNSQLRFQVLQNRPDTKHSSPFPIVASIRQCFPVFGFNASCRCSRFTHQSQKVYSKNKVLILWENKNHNFGGKCTILQEQSHHFTRKKCNIMGIKL